MHIVTTDFSLLPGEVKSFGVPEERCICSEPTALMIEHRTLMDGLKSNLTKLVEPTALLECGR